MEASLFVRPASSGSLLALGERWMLPRGVPHELAERDFAHLASLDSANHPLGRWLIPSNELSLSRIVRVPGRRELRSPELRILRQEVSEMVRMVRYAHPFPRVAGEPI